MEHPRTWYLLAVLGATGCAAATAAPKQARIEAHSTLQSAEALAGATETPHISRHLANARSDILSGEKSLARGRHDLARFYFERGEVEAEAAIAQARAIEAEQQAMRAEAPLQKGEDEQ